jgi:response regulator RpfG family c-di-GMP phosphodiesterase
MDEDFAKEMSLLMRVAMNFSLIATKNLEKKEQEQVEHGVDEILKHIKTPEMLADFVINSLHTYVNDEQAFQKFSSLIGMSALALKKMEEQSGRKVS